MKMEITEYLIEGGWHGGVCYEVRKHDGAGRWPLVFGGPMKNQRQCKRYIRKRHKSPDWGVKFIRKGGVLLAICKRDRNVHTS